MTVIQSRGFWLLSNLSNAAFPIFTTTGQHAQRSITHTQLKIFLTSHQNFPWDNLQLLPLISALGTSRKRQAPCPVKLLQRVAKHSPVLSSEDWTQFSASTQRLFASPSEHLGIPFQYFSVRFDSSSDNRDSSPQGRTYTAKRLPKTVFCC